MGPLTDFWRQREEAEFKGVDDVPVRFVRFCAQNNDRLVLICPGRIESYVKYAEVAYDLFHSGFDVMIIDHRGQGRSGRLLSDTHRGHVVNFSDYVDDLAALWQQPGGPRTLAKTVYPRSLYGRGDCHAFSATLPGALRCDCALRADVRDYHSIAGLDGAPYSRLG